jgi:PAS domain S-box-containing protein
MENRLLEAEQMLKLLETAVAQAKEVVLITSAQLEPPGPEILFVNPAFSEMTGYSQEEVLQKTPRILQGPKSDRAMLTELREALSRGEPFSGETVNYRKDGSEYYVEWDITPIRTSGGKISHFLSIQRNVTARKLAVQIIMLTENVIMIALVAGDTRIRKIAGIGIINNAQSIGA